MKSKLHAADNWKGIWTALISPFEKKVGAWAIDKKSLSQLIERQLEDGIHGFVIAGSTGEGSLLTPSLYSELLKSSRKIIGKRAYMVAGLGIGGTESCLKNVEVAKKMGADGVLASPPAYIKTPPRLLKDHFLKLGSKGIPLCLYEIPGRAASSMSVDFIISLLAEKNAKNIVALKDATGDMPRIISEAQSLASRMALLSGDDGSFAPFLKNGGHGVISVATHFLPLQFRSILRLSQNKEWEKAQALQNEISAFVEALFMESNPIPVKSLAAKTKWIRKDLFLPPLAAMEKVKLDELFALYSKIPAPKELP
jgi:4-hydroxy-tetrahydrodipicolinate synthase